MTLLLFKINQIVEIPDKGGSMKRLIILILVFILTISYIDFLQAMEGQPYPQQQQGWSKYHFLFEDYYGRKYYMRFLTDGYNLYGFRQADTHSPEMIGAFCIGGVEYVGTRDGNYFYQCHPYER
jgi:hypothetical protein